MTTKEDKEQNVEIDRLKEDVSQIKNITHGSKELGWDGIIVEHKKLSNSVGEIVTSFKAIWNAIKWFVGAAITIGGGVVTLISIGIIKI